MSVELLPALRQDEGASRSRADKGVSIQHAPPKPRTLSQMGSFFVFTFPVEMWFLVAIGPIFFKGQSGTRIGLFFIGTVNRWSLSTSQASPTRVKAGTKVIFRRISGCQLPSYRLLGTLGADSSFDRGR